MPINFAVIFLSSYCARLLVRALQSKLCRNDVHDGDFRNTIMNTMQARKQRVASKVVLNVVSHLSVCADELVGPTVILGQRP